MASFGENLKREREMRGVPLREIADSTKINLHFLQALEDEEFDKLPGGVFNRGFIRAYSRHLGLDEQKLLGEYDLVLGKKEPFETLRVQAAPQPPPLEATSSQAQLLAAAIAVVMLLIGYALYRYSDQPITPETPSESATAASEQTPAAIESPDEAGTQSGPAPPSPVPVQETPRQVATLPAATTPAPQSPTPRPTPVPAATQASAATPPDSTTSPAPAPAPEGQEQATAEPEETAPTVSQQAPSVPAPEPAVTEDNNADEGAAGTSDPAPSASSASEDLVLRVTTTEQAWVFITADGRTVVQRTLEADEIRTFRAKEFFQLRTGNARSLILTLNGETLAPLGNRPSQVRSIRLTRENLASGNP